MLYKFWMSMLKEFLLLKRDLGGLVILFVMPLVLIITITLIQDNAFKTTNSNKIPILLVDNDGGFISKTVAANLNANEAFQIITSLSNKPITVDQAQDLVFSGQYQLAIVIPKDLSIDLERKVSQNVNQIMQNLGVSEATTTAALKTSKIESKEIKLFFDPATQITFKNAVKNAVDQMIAKIENQSIYDSFKKELGTGEDAFFEQESFIVFTEVIPKVNNKEELPNSVQHNVPAWSLFAIFFIIVPLSINMVKEKSQGTMTRLMINPTPHLILLMGKTITYLLICLIQFLLMVAIGVYLFPYLGLPVLNIEGRLLLLIVVAIFSGLAAIGLGILLGTIAKTQEQSAPFGATSVVILAAIGGVWVPVFAMPKVMQLVSNISPMNWGLNAFYDVLLRNGGLQQIAPELSFLFLFFIITLTISVVYDTKKRAV